MIYLDNAATTYPKPECVYQSLDYANRNYAYNAGRGNYFESNKAFTIIDDARDSVASIVRLNKNSVYFSSSATEALNQIIYGLPLEDGDTVFISPFEHNAVVRPLYQLKKRIDFNIELIPFDSITWEIKEKELINILSKKKPKAIFITQISNVTGYKLPYERIFSISKQICNSINILDSAQAFGILPIKISNVDYIVFAGHKSLYSSFGIAGFIQVKKDVLSVVKAGGTGSDSKNVYMADQGCNKFEAGSMNVVAATGLIKSIEWLKKIDVASHEDALTKYAIEKLSLLNGVELFIPSSKEVFGIISFAIKNYISEDVGTILYDEYSICCRTGYHCAPFIHDFIHSNQYGGTIRVSFSFFNTKQDIDNLILGIKSILGE